MIKLMMKEKYSILMPYHKRAGHLHNTLVSFERHYKDRKDYEIIIVEDVKNSVNVSEHLMLNNIINHFKDIPIRRTVGGAVFQWNPASLFNIASKMASGDYFIITNPECLHKVDVLRGLDDEFEKDPDVYVICACESAKDFPLFIKLYEDFSYSHHRWYQHSEHRNVMYHFCNAISKDNYFKAGGFDERFALGMGYDDDDFLKSVLNSGVNVVLRDDFHTVHQWHGKAPRPQNYLHLYKKNEALYQEKWGKQC